MSQGTDVSSGLVGRGTWEGECSSCQRPSALLLSESGGVSLGILLAGGGSKHTLESVICLQCS